MKAKKEAGRKRPGAFLLYLGEDQRARLEAYRAKLEQAEGTRFGIPRRVSTADVVRLALERLFASPAEAGGVAVGHRPGSEGRLPEETAERLVGLYRHLELEVPPSLLGATATESDGEAAVFAKRPEAGTLDGAALKAAREKAGVSQAVFAKRLRVSQPSLSSWERGKRAVPAERAEELRRLLGP